MLDKWINGSANRISPEAPVLILKQETTTASVGGAANLAVNLANIIDENIELYGALSMIDDSSVNFLVEIQKYMNIDLYLDDSHTITTTKTRLMDSTGHYLIRLDSEELYTGTECVDTLMSSLNKNDIVIISDYAKGVIQEDTVARILRKIPFVYVDPKQDVKFYKGAYLIKPNLIEYEQWNGKFEIKSAHRFMKKQKWTWLVVTAGENGIHVIHKSGEYHHVKAPMREVSDVTGAGDTVLAVIARSIANNIEVPEACRIACHAASKGVERRGVVPVTLDDLIMDELVFTNGVFDVLHTGHLELLKFCSEQGKRLIVGLNSDESVKRLKGPGRPINNLEARRSQIEALPWVDEVVVFEEDSPYEILQEICPDIIIKGGDYTVDQVVGHDLAKVIIFKTVDNYSSSAIIERTEGE